MGWSRRPTAVTRGGGARKPLAVALLGPIAAIALLAATCGKSDESTGALVPIVPLDSIVPADGGRTLPDPARVLLNNAGQDLRAGNYAAAAQAAQQTRQEAHQKAHQRARNGPAQSATPGAPPNAEDVTGYVADAVEGVAQIDLGDTAAGLGLLKRGERAIDLVPADVRVRLATLIYRAQIVGYARTGEDAEAQRSLTNALMIAPDQKDLFVTELCQAARQPSSFARCTAPPVMTTPPGGTTGTTSATPPKPTPPKPTSTTPTTRKPAPPSTPPTTSEPSPTTTPSR